jgi:hypothetical protein
MRGASILCMILFIIAIGCNSKIIKQIPLSLDPSLCESYPEKEFLPVANEKYSSVQRFHEVFYQAKRSKVGQIDVLFLIDTTGTISHCAVENSTLNDPDFEAQLLTRLKRWRLPAQSVFNSDVDCFSFRYTFIFGR